MKTKRTIALEGVKIYGYHGVMENERKIGTDYIINLKIAYDWSEAGKNDRLEGTINYASLYTIICEEMAQVSLLIENVAQRIYDRVLSEFKEITAIKVEVKKCAPPLGGDVEASAVCIEGEL